MNVQEFDLLQSLTKNSIITQRELSELTGYSVGKVNSSLKVLIENEYLDKEMKLTSKAVQEIHQNRPHNAIILAAGYGMRMVPINVEVPKGLLTVHKEPLIERIIKQLQEVGVFKIDIVVGFMKEKYEYLIDKYNINLVFNKDYSTKNNLHSLLKIKDAIENTYIVPCDLWCQENPFAKKEFYSWYMVKDCKTDESRIRINRKKELVTIKNEEQGNQMIGIAYILKKEAEILKEQLERLGSQKEYYHCFWEEALMLQEKMFVYPKMMKADSVFEINTLEELRELDEQSKQLDSSILDMIAKVLKVQKNEIKDIRALKIGMTNRSFGFQCESKNYIMRIPGEGTEKMIDRAQEYEVYQVLKNKISTDPLMYMDPKTGYKITEFIENSRVCDAQNQEDVRRCMKHLKKFHDLELRVPHTFDLFEQINYYESLWNGEKSIYRDYQETKNKITELKQYVEQQPRCMSLTHMDAVPDNFLLTENEIYLIDWEYAGMQDVHVDIAMFAIYAMYSREQIDWLIDTYFEHVCNKKVRMKIYCYIAICGLLWSNWCEYKRQCGVEFGEYSLKQYRYAKEFYEIVRQEI